MGIISWRQAMPGSALIVSLVAAALIWGCGGEEADGSAEIRTDAPVAASAPGAADPAPRAENSSSPAATSPPVAVAAESESTADGGGNRGNAVAIGQAYSALTPTSQNQAGRRLVVEAWISLQVDAVDPAARQVEAAATQRGGWVESADIVGEGGYRSASINIRVPSERFDETMVALRAFGLVTDEGVSAEDVTDRLIDNEARMTAWRAQEERLIVLLENAATVEDIVDIERRIAEVRTDIELVAATQRNLENRVAASLIRVNLHLPKRFAADPPTGQLTLAVGNPTATGDAIISRVESLRGYTGAKREYRHNRSDVVELTAFVRPTDLDGLMEYAGTLGEITDRRLDSVGPSPASDIPNARLTLAIRSNVNSAAALSLSTADAIVVAGLIRVRAESLGGYVESWKEVRQDDGDIINLAVVVKASDLRAIMEYGATLGETENWEYSAVGQSPADAEPNARLQVSVFTEEGIGEVVSALTVGVIITAIVIGVGGIIALLLLRRRARRSGGSVSSPPLLGSDDGDAGAAGNVSG